MGPIRSQLAPFDDFSGRRGGGARGAVLGQAGKGRLFCSGEGAAGGAGDSTTFAGSRQGLENLENPASTLQKCETFNKTKTFLEFV